MCIQTGNIEWFFGGYKAGKFNDLELAREEFTSRMLPGEKAIADKVYSDKTFFINPQTFFVTQTRECQSMD